MWERFTVEEINLMCIFGTTGKDRLIAEIINAAEAFDDEMVDIAESLIKKLHNMSDADFDALELYPEYEEHDESEV